MGALYTSLDIKRRYFLRAALAWSIFISLLLFTPSSWAIEILFAEPQVFGERAQTIAKSLKRAISEYTSYQISTIPSKTAQVLNGNDRLIVTLGPEAFREVLSGSGNSPILAVFISKSSFDTIVSRNSAGRSGSRSVSAIFSNPDPLRQVALVKAIYGPTASSSLINSPSVKAYVSDYVKAAKLLDVKLNIVNLQDTDSSSDLIQATKESRSLFLLKDKDLFNKFPLEKVLLSSYDINRQGVIGYSRGLVKSGGAATTYSSIDNIAHSIYLQANKLPNHGLDRPHYTDSFEIALNKYVLRSLDLADMNNETIQNKILTLIRLASGERL